MSIRYFGPLRPWVTDEMWRKVIGVAASPVVTEWHVAGSILVGFDSDAHRELIATFDDRIIFLAVLAEENPTPALECVGSVRPAITIHRRGGSKPS